MNRRRFLDAARMFALTTTAATAAAAAPAARSSVSLRAAHRPDRKKRTPLKLSCNLYSFNSVLRNGQMTLEEVLEFCADLGFEAVDPTAYYFPGYPAVPDDSYTYRIKRRAFRLGLDISGTGVRNDFTLADLKQRSGEVELVRKWVDFAARFGAPVLRVFSGKGIPAGHTEAEVNGWVVEALRECAAYGARHGVMIVLQNHADFIQTGDQVLRILRMVDSEWLAVNLDIGSFRRTDPYAEIAKLAPYAATWQIKENLFINGKEAKTDLERIFRIVRASGYRGYLPIETLGEGDPRVKVPRFLDEVREKLAASAAPS